MSTAPPHHRGRIAGLLLTLILGGGLGEARAGLGILVSDPILIPVEDPLTEYDFKLALDSGDQILRNDFITLLNVPSYNGVARYVFGSGNPDFSQYFTIRAGEGTTPGTTSIQLQLTASPITFSNTTSAPISIGDLFIETTEQYPPAAGSPIFNPINFLSQTHLTNGLLNVQTGTVQAQAVPEPSSLALLGVGGGTAAVLARRRRQRRPA